MELLLGKHEIFEFLHRVVLLGQQSPALSLGLGFGGDGALVGHEQNGVLELFFAKRQLLLSGRRLAFALA